MQELDYLAIGMRIRKQREFLGYTRAYMAERAEVTENFCRDIEIGAKGMSLQTLVNISLILKLSVNYILMGETEDNNTEPLVNMLKACKPDKLRYAEEILKTFLLAIE